MCVTLRASLHEVRINDWLTYFYIDVVDSRPNACLQIKLAANTPPKTLHVYARVHAQLYFLTTGMLTRESAWHRD